MWKGNATGVYNMLWTKKLTGDQSDITRVETPRYRNSVMKSQHKMGSNDNGCFTRAARTEL